MPLPVVRQWTFPWRHRTHEDQGQIASAPATDAAPTAIAVHDECGRICVDIADEESINLTLLQAQRREYEDSALQSKSSASDTTFEDVPTMNICIMIVGTRGDVQPFIGIAKRLQQDGHRVRLATHAVYRDFVTEHHVEFYPLGGDPKELAAYMVKTGGHLIPLKYETITKDVPRNLQMIDEILNSTWPAVSAVDPDALGEGVPGKPFQAQAIISNPVTYGHIHVAERLGVPLHIMFPQPWVPTVAFPHPLSNMPYDDKPQKRNYMSYKLVDLLMWQGTESIVNQFRTQVLGLRKIRKGDGGRDMLLDLAIPHAFMWSPALVPKPADWGNIYDVIGTVLLKEVGSNYTPTPELEAFLGTDGGPIFVGFGSMVIADPKATTTMIIEAARLANVRVLIQSSWSDMAAGIDVPDNIFLIGNCPHDWLMPRVSAVVHHGGAGTTAAGLLAGKPTFIVPFFGDQPFWGRAVVRVGVGVEPCPISELSVEKLHKAFVGLQTPEIRARALALRDVMNSEDGVGEAVKCFYRHLPLKVMRCEVCEKNLATKWSVSVRLRLCAVCHFVVLSAGRNNARNYIDYRCMKYDTRGPSSGFAGAAAGVGAFLHEVGGAFKDVFVKPARGFRHDGAKGVAVGVAQGLGGLVIRPVYGVALLADHIATGHVNYFRADGTSRRNTVLDSRIQSVLGHGDPSSTVVAAGMSGYEIMERAELVSKTMRRETIVVKLTEQDKQELCAKFRELQTLREAHAAPELSSEFVAIPLDDTSRDAVPASEISAPVPAAMEALPQVTLLSAEFDSSGSISVRFDVDDDTVDKATMQHVETYWAERRKKLTRDDAQLLRNPALSPKMNVCLATIGTWHHNVKQYVAIALRLASDGHRVRVAAHGLYREEITSRGLEFYQLEGSPKNMHDMLRHLQSATGPKRERKGLFATSNVKVPADVRAALFSLWPACTSADPDGAGIGIPGDSFRADILIAHPLLLSHIHVAERLGIPLHCVSMTPLSPTLAFPHVLTSQIHEPKSSPVDEFRESNYLSYSVVNRVLHNALVGVVDEFRASIGLSGGWVRPSLLVDLEIPHTYLWEPSVIQRPLDWGPHISVAGHVSLMDNRERQKASKMKTSRSFNEFVLSTGAPVIYIGFSSIGLDAPTIKSIFQRVDAASKLASVLVVAQVFNDRLATKPYHSDRVYEVANDVPFALILRKVAATIHWGSPSMTWECLADAKPFCIWPRLSTQRWFAHALSKAGCGPPPMELSTDSTKALATTFQSLIDFELRSRIADLAIQCSSDAALERVVESIYSNLPTPAMECDLDPTKVAHVYDVVHEMKLSYEAHLATLEIRGRHDKQHIPYKPLYYSGYRPPKYALRGLRGDPHRSTSPPGLPRFMSTTLNWMLHPDDATLKQHPKGSAHVLRRTQSLLPEVHVRPKYWSSDDEEQRESERILAAYDRIVRGQLRGPSEE